jgi:hypothetical protein
MSLPRPGTALRCVTAVILCLLIHSSGMAWAAGGDAAVARLTPEQQAWLRPAHHHPKQGWIYLHLEGAPHARGFQHGYLLAGPIAESLRATRSMWEHDSAMEWSWLVAKSQNLLVPKIDPENQEELDGIVAGLQAAGVASSRAELVAYNAYFELAWYWWPKEKKKLQETRLEARKQSCSSFIATGRMTADGGVVLGHNTMLDYPLATYNVIVDIQPAQGHRVLMQTAPGLIHSGTDFFVTDAGLVGSETTIGGFDSYDEDGIPEFVRMRRATQDATTIDEWCAIMKRGNNGGYANAWLLGDVRSGEIARLELGLRYVNLEKKRDGFFLGSNIAETPKLLRLETDANDNDVRLSSVARRVRWKKLMAQNAGRIDARRARQFEADHYDSYFEQNRLGARGLCAHYERDRAFWGSWPGGPFYPAGTFDGKVVDSQMAKQMSFAARWGAACGTPFDATKFLAAHPQFDWMRGILRSRPAQPWTVFRAGESQ